MEESYYSEIDRYCYTRFMLTCIETVCQMSDKEQRRIGGVVRALYKETSSSGGDCLDIVLVQVGVTVGDFAIGSRERRDRTQRRVLDTTKTEPSKRARAAMMATLVEVGDVTAVDP